LDLSVLRGRKFHVNHRELEEKARRAQSRILISVCDSVFKWQQFFSSRRDRRVFFASLAFFAGKFFMPTLLFMFAQRRGDHRVLLCELSVLCEQFFSNTLFSRRDAETAEFGSGGNQEAGHKGTRRKNLCDLCDCGFLDLSVLRGRKFHVNHREHEEKARRAQSRKLISVCVFVFSWQYF
jgi:hypothetical protein